MARPCKSIETSTGKIGKEAIKARQEAEDNLRGSSDNIKAPSYLSPSQKKIFNNIIKELKSSGILGNLDIYILATGSIAIDRLQDIESLINENINKLSDKNLMAAKEKYTKDFFRCCTELSLSSQSRAKISNLNIQAKQAEADPLLAILAGNNKAGDDD